MEMPDCFGRWWESIPGLHGELCRQCSVSDACLIELATNRYPVVLARLGGQAPLAVLSEALGLDEQAVLVVMAHAVDSRRTPVEKPMRKNGRRTWGPHTYLGRWTREREKHPEIGALTPGTRIQKNFRGQVYEVTIKKGGYELEGETYPTLAAVTSEIAGERARRKTVDFWGLREAD